MRRPRSARQANGNSNTSGSNLGDVRLIVGQISFDTGADGADRYTLYDYQLSGGSIADGGLGDPISTTLEIDVDQGSLDILNLTRQVNLNWDEVRIGTTLESVLGVAPGSSFAITEIDYSSESGMLTRTWNSRPAETYAVKFSGDMSNWDSDLDDEIPADEEGTTTTETFDLSEDSILKDATRVYFRVEK
jgi:hypothetical protein